VGEADKPDVSVVIAAYKATYFDEALQSALNQTHANIEVVVIDDSPSDRIEHITKSHSDPRIVYSRNDTNLGPVRSFGRGFDVASGNFIGILNDDDVWDRDFAATLLLALADEPSAVVAFSDHWVISDTRRDQSASDDCSKMWGRDILEAGLHQPFHELAMVKRSVPIAVSALFRRDLVQGSSLPSEVGGAYDFYIAYLLCRTGGGAVYVPARMNGWRVHASNLTGVATPQRAAEGVAVLDEAYQDPALANLRSEMAVPYSQSLWSLGLREVQASERRRAIGTGWKMLRIKAWRGAAVLGLAVLPQFVLKRLTRG
jgi:glycosyltransferase involved in cell wall biosynthesis